MTRDLIDYDTQIELYNQNNEPDPEDTRDVDAEIKDEE